MTGDFNFRTGRFALALIFSSSIASAAITQTPKDQPTTTQRQSMSERHKELSEIHAKMASCLDSDKTFDVAVKK